MAEAGFPRVAWQGRAGGWRAAHSDVAEEAGKEYRVVLTGSGRCLVEQHDDEDSMGAPRWNPCPPAALWGVVECLVGELEAARYAAQSRQEPRFATERPEAQTIVAEEPAEAQEQNSPGAEPGPFKRVVLAPHMVFNPAPDRNP